MSIIWSLRNWLEHIWVDYRLGTIFALISMVVVVFTYVRLARTFVHSSNRLKIWPKLFVHALWRVLLTICMYFGPVWTIERIIDLIQGIWDNIVAFFDFVSKADRLTVILMTTIIVLSVFLAVTGVAVFQYLRKRYRIWKREREEKSRQ